MKTSSDILSELRGSALRSATSLNLSSLGLRQVPDELFTGAPDVKVLDLSANELETLPHDFALLAKLEVVFLSRNRFRELPEILGQCRALRFIGARDNQISHLAGSALPPNLEWLTLTSNQLTELPADFGKLIKLRKLLLAGNQLLKLPPSILRCQELELLRGAANSFEVLPPEIALLPKLAWLSFSGNPVITAPSPLDPIQSLPLSSVILTESVGKGASGSSMRGVLRDSPQIEVVVKFFDSSVSSDSAAVDEISAALAAAGVPGAIESIAQVVDDIGRPIGIVSRYAGESFVRLGEPPTFDSVTRDIFQAERLAASLPILQVLQSVAVSLSSLHERKLMHGDLYAHNILVSDQGHALLGDFGATWSYTSLAAELHPALQAIEVRAYGYLIDDLVRNSFGASLSQRVHGALCGLRDACLSINPHERPSIQELPQHLDEVQKR